MGSAEFLKLDAFLGEIGEACSPNLPTDSAPLSCFSSGTTGSFTWNLAPNWLRPGSSSTAGYSTSRLGLSDVIIVTPCCLQVVNKSCDLQHEILENQKVKEIPFYYEDENKEIDLEQYKNAILSLSNLETVEKIEKLLLQKTGVAAKIFLPDWQPPKLYFWSPIKENSLIDYAELNIAIQILSHSEYIAWTSLSHYPATNPTIQTAIDFNVNNIDNIKKLLTRFEEKFTQFFFTAKEACRCKPTSINYLTPK